MTFPSVKRLTLLGLLAVLTSPGLYAPVQHHGLTHRQSLYKGLYSQIYEEDKNNSLISHAQVIVGSRVHSDSV